MKKLVAPSYMITWSDSIYHQMVKVIATSYDHKTYKPVQWAVRLGESTMNKTNGLFMSLSRTEKYLKDYRFDTAKQATEAYWKTRKKAERFMNAFNKK